MSDNMNSEPPRSLSDYKQQFIPNKILKTFDVEKSPEYRDFATKPSINWAEYIDYEHIIAYLYELRRTYPKLVKIFPIGKTTCKRQMIVVRVSPPEGTLFDRIFVEGGIHGNEWISPAAVLYFIYKLVSEWNELPNYMKTKTWLILPLANPDGYVYAHSSKSNSLWRKNLYATSKEECVGIDLNRNFSVGWDKNQEAEDRSSAEYKGLTSFSELETRAIRNFLMPQKKYLKAYIAFHSFGQQIRYQWIYTTPIDDLERVQEVAKQAEDRINNTAGKKKWKYNTVDKPIRRLFGLSRDWARKYLNVKYSYTVQLRDSGQKGFNLDPKLTSAVGIDVFSFLETISKAITDDSNGLKKKFFIIQDFDHLLERQSYLYKRRSRR